MSRSCTRKLAVILGFVLAALGGTARAQEPEQPPLSLTGRILFGYADLSESPYGQSGPAATLETTLSGYWRDPRILQFSVKPMVTLGEAVPGTEMGNALTGFSGMAIILQGSPFPLTVSYSRTGSSFDESRSGASANPNQDVLSGAETNLTYSVFDANWIWRFRHLPIVNLNYSDRDYSADLPKAFGGGDDHYLRNFTAQINYSMGGWQAGGWYLRSQSRTTSPDILTQGVQHTYNDTTNLGFDVSRLLPLHSTLSVSANQSKSNFNFDDLESNTTVRTANATLSSQPVERLSTTLQAQYDSNLQASEVQQALAGAGVPGTSPSPVPASTAPLTYLAAPFKITTLSGGAGLRLGYGFSLTGNAGESHSENSGTLTRWGAGPGYQHKWRSGWISANYSYSHLATRTEVVSANATAGVVNTGSGTAPYSLFSEVINANTGSMNLGQDLPWQFKLVTSAHVSEGAEKDNGVPYPNHDYGGFASVVRPVGEWTLTGSFNLENNAANHELLYNRSTAKGISLGAGYRGLNLSAGYQYGSGLAIQMGNSLLFVTSPVVVSPLLGIPTMSSSSGATLTGSYRSRRGRLTVMGYAERFSYTTDHLPATEFSLINLHVSYKLRRLRLIGGYTRQSQLFRVGPLGTYETRLMYFQIERVFRLY